MQRVLTEVTRVKQSHQKSARGYSNATFFVIASIAVTLLILLLVSVSREHTNLNTCVLKCFEELRLVAK